MRRWLLAAGVAAIFVIVQTAAAGVVMPATAVSPNPSPFAACANQGLQGNYPNAEIEP
jgi:hypothetical protein